MQYVLSLVTLILNIFVCVYLLYGKYSFKNDNVKKRTAVIAAAVILKSLIYFVQIPMINFVSSSLLTVLIVYITFSCNKASLFIFSALLIMILFSSETLGIIIVSSFHSNTISDALQEVFILQRHIWNWLIQIVFCRIAKLLIQKRSIFDIKWHEIIFYVLMTAFEVGIFAYSSQNVEHNSSGIAILIILIGFLILDIYIMYVFQRLSSLREKERQADLMNQQEKLQLQMYRELQEMYKNTCKTAHDMNRHISALKELSKSNTNVHRYLSDLTETVKNLQPRIKNQNEILEIILNTVALRCEKSKIKFDMEIEDFSLDFISDMDMTTIFSNLLDNAVEECERLNIKNKTIRIVLRRNMGLVALRITNPCEKKIINFNGFKSTKENHLGVGLSNVRNTAEKYNGVLSVKSDKNLFQASVTLPIN